LALGTSYCPKLREVSIFFPFSSLPDYDGLKEFLRGRREGGIPIQRLYFDKDRYSPSFEPEAIKQLQEYVLEVWEQVGRGW